MKIKTILGCVVIVAMALTPSAHAATIALYDFSGGYTATTEHADVTAGTMIPGVEIAGSGFIISNTTINDGAPIIASGTDANPQYISGATPDSVTFDTGGIANSLAASITSDHYLGFTITPDLNMSVDPTQLSVKLGKDNQGVGPRAELLTSQGGGWVAANSLGQFHHTINSAASTYTWDLSSLSDFTTATEFRLYFHDTASSGWHDMLADDVLLEGTVTVIPEPSTFALLALGLTGLFLLRRR
jgi:hypothetical protein